MRWLNELGFDAFLGLGVTTRAELLLPPHIVAGRLLALAQLVEPGSAHQRIVQEYLERGLYPWFMAPADWEELDFPLDSDGALGDNHHFWKQDEMEDPAVHLVAPESGTRRGSANGSAHSPAGHIEAPGILELRIAGILRRTWEFHIGDPDPYPSVPHGHTLAGSPKKLDAYRGWIYANGQRVSRETRGSIIALWNDEKFRTFAFEALGHMQSTDPTFLSRLHKERGIRDPLRLPRRRN